MADKALSLDLVLEVREESAHKVYKFGFGDGYEQIRKAGINSKVRSYNIKTRPLESADSDDLRSDLDDVCTGDYFVATLTPYTSQSRRYRIPDSTYSRQWLPNSETTIYTFTLEEAHTVQD